jgi:hypothetical protein
MAKRLLCVMLLLMLGWQAIAQAAVAVHADAAMQEHCAGHEDTQPSCECCPDGLGMSAGCATLCSATAALPTLMIDTPEHTAVERHVLTVRESPGPAYLPLNPPPISWR